MDALSYAGNSMLQSTSLLRGKTLPLFLFHLVVYASIHFPLAREDKIGARLDIAGLVLQSTSLLRGKTSMSKAVSKVWEASIHFPLAREDACPAIHLTSLQRFNPLPSCEGRLYMDCLLRHLARFNPLPSCEGRR